MSWEVFASLGIMIYIFGAILILFILYMLFPFIFKFVTMFIKFMIDVVTLPLRMFGKVNKGLDSGAKKVKKKFT